MTITEFLTARLDEDEEVARRVPQWQAPEELRAMTTRGSIDPPFLVVASERVLRDVVAKRAVVGLHSSHWSGDCWSCSGDHGADPTPAPCDTVRHLAAVYADHPDYQQEWAP
jgi:hypothetical protein